MTTTTDSALTCTEITHYEGPHLRGGAANQYYADPSQRQIILLLTSSTQGTCYVSVAYGRLNNVGTPVVDGYLGHSPLFTTAEDAHAWAHTVKDYTLTARGDSWHDREIPKPEGWQVSAPSLCPRCGNHDTIDVRLEGYGDRTTCTACNDEHFYSIGD